LGLDDEDGFALVVLAQVEGFEIEGAAGSFVEKLEF